MKKNTLKTAGALISALILLLSFTSCSSKLKLKGSKIVDPKTGSEYVYVPGNFIPKSVSEEVYATFRYNGVSVKYFEIEGLKPTEWLYSEIGDLIYSGNEKLPTFTEFGAKKMFICYNNDVMFSLAEISNSDSLAEIIKCYNEGEKLSPNYFNANTYRLIFESDSYKSIYYMLNLVVTPEGYFIYNRFEGYMVDAGDLLSPYVEPYSYAEDY
ncbi:MAG: hypothetical protein MJ137_03655 [Clostridia bacterium]|nr:hypothetical protein [Clostridia bacterium]